jgi:hypothetical protein
MKMLQGHTAWTYSMDNMDRDMQQRHAALTCSLVASAYIKQGHAARTYIMNMLQGHAAGLCSMDMQQAHARTFSINAA